MLLADLHYDVFTDRRLTGNQLAVFLDGRGLGPRTSIVSGTCPRSEQNAFMDFIQSRPAVPQTEATMKAKIWFVRAKSGGGAVGSRA